MRPRVVKDTGDLVMLEYGEWTSGKGHWRCFPKAQMERCNNRMLKGHFLLCCIADREPRCASGPTLGDGPSERQDGKRTIALNGGVWCSPDLPPTSLSTALCRPVGGPSSLVSRLLNTRDLGQLAEHRRLKWVGPSG